MLQRTHGIAYRADIDGLRAVAILLVVAAHAGVPWLEGGFVGVDVFFVLSGFLITSLLLSEASATGRIDLPAFFARRLRRLLPALVLMVLVVSVAAAILLAPIEHAPQAAAAKAALLWISNFLFAFQSIDYFGPTASTNLFLHTWSLGVEEQFYLVWPLLLMLFAGLLGQSRDRVRKARLAAGLAGTLLVCGLLSVFLTTAIPMWAFYLMPSRGWQFALGGLFALLSIKDFSADQALRERDGAFPGRVRTVLGWVGLASIIGSGVLLHKELAYPGFWALAPSLGTALVLFGCAARTRSLESVLANRPMRSLGRVSYSWYLWHWPVLLLGAAMGLDEPVDRLVLVIASLLVASASYRFVESPIRYHRRLVTLPRMTLAASAALMAAPVLGAGRWQLLAAETWQHDPEQERYARYRSNLPSIYGMGCDEWFYTDRVRICAFGEQDAQHTAVLIGDSLMGQWFPAIAPIFADQPDWRLLVITKSACPMVDESYFYERIGATYVVCDRWRTNALKELESLHPDIVFVGSSIYSFDQHQWIAGTRRVLERIAPAAKSVLVFRTTPILPFDGLTCLARKAWRPELFSFDTHCEAPAKRTEGENVHRWIQRAASDFENVTVLDMTPLVCPDDVCAAERNGQVVYRDAQHLAAEFVASLAAPLRMIVLDAAGHP